ncbi:MAG: PilT/PilU family type 4a pilus ATPase [Candidatus Falkowbacteria bacterium]|nr:PilT/PilU family type 4a pilus ATPase [Candidatus Falkowbacteria bacterium]
MLDIKKLLQIAATKSASDLHLVVSLPPIFRIDGELFSLDEILKKKDFGDVITEKELQEAISLILTPEQKTKFFVDRDLDIGYALNDLRFRINLSYEKDNMKLVARVITEEQPTLEQIGMPKIVYELLNQPQGLVLLTGPTGCGKSTTLAAMINYINNNRSCNIVTFEDPIEFLFKSNKSVITQRQLGSDMISFAKGLKYVLRQDPNVIMVGEMRDLETIAAAITIAETGHLVLATLHTYNAAQTVDRIIDIFPPHQQNQVRAQLSMILSGVISQRLLPKVGGGRIAAREIMIRNSAVSNLIRENKIAQLKSVLQTSGADGMVTLDKHIKELYNKGLITQEVALGQMENPNELE